jgi:hypothetical protein
MRAAVASLRQVSDNVNKEGDDALNKTDEGATDSEMESNNENITTGMSDVSVNTADQQSKMSTPTTEQSKMSTSTAEQRKMPDPTSDQSISSVTQKEPTIYPTANTEEESFTTTQSRTNVSPAVATPQPQKPRPPPLPPCRGHNCPAKERQSWWAVDIGEFTLNIGKVIIVNRPGKIGLYLKFTPESALSKPIHTKSLEPTKKTVLQRGFHVDNDLANAVSPFCHVKCLVEIAR